MDFLILIVLILILVVNVLNYLETRQYDPDSGMEKSKWCLLKGKLNGIR